LLFLRSSNEPCISNDKSDQVTKVANFVSPVWHIYSEKEHCKDNLCTLYFNVAIPQAELYVMLNTKKCIINKLAIEKKDAIFFTTK